MKFYKNLNGTSGVREYELGPDFIKVKFADGAIYTYSSQSAGLTMIRQMKDLAEAGRGLNRFITLEVKDKFADKKLPDGEIIDQNILWS